MVSVQEIVQMTLGKWTFLCSMFPPSQMQNSPEEIVRMEAKLDWAAVGFPSSISTQS